MSAPLSIATACMIAEDLKRNPENLEIHLRTLIGRSVDAEVLRESSLEFAIARFVHDKARGEAVSKLLMSYCEISSVARNEYYMQMERLRNIRDSLCPERPPHPLDKIFKRRKWTPLPYDKDENTMRRYMNEMPRAVILPKVTKRKKRKASHEENQRPVKSAKVEIEERPMETMEGAAEQKRIILRIQFQNP